LFAIRHSVIRSTGHVLSILLILLGVRPSEKYFVPNRLRERPRAFGSSYEIPGVIGQLRYSVQIQIGQIAGRKVSTGIPQVRLELGDPFGKDHIRLQQSKEPVFEGFLDTEDAPRPFCVQDKDPRPMAIDRNQWKAYWAQVDPSSGVAGTWQYAN